MTHNWHGHGLYLLKYYFVPLDAASSAAADA